MLRLQIYFTFYIFFAVFTLIYFQGSLMISTIGIKSSIVINKMNLWLVPYYPRKTIQKGMCI